MEVFLLCESAVVMQQNGLEILPHLSKKQKKTVRTIIPYLYTTLNGKNSFKQNIVHCLFHKNKGELHHFVLKHTGGMCNYTNKKLPIFSLIGCTYLDFNK